MTRDTELVRDLLQYVEVATENSGLNSESIDMPDYERREIDNALQSIIDDGYIEFVENKALMDDRPMCFIKRLSSRGRRYLNSLRGDTD